LNALRVFEAAARHLSFKEAAAELNITQAAVSHQVKSLEDYLGVDLFRRAGRGVQLTEAAKACLPKLREGFEALAAAVEMIRERAGEAELVITAPPVFIGTDPRSDSSGVEIHLGVGDYPGHRADRLFEVRMVLVASPELIEGKPPLREPADLAHHVLLHDDAMEIVAHGNAWQKWLEAAGVADRVDGSRGPHFSSNILSLEAASQKLGVALALRPLIDADVASGRLRKPFDVEVNPRSAYYLICPEVIAERPAVKAFRSWLLKQV